MRIVDPLNRETLKRGSALLLTLLTLHVFNPSTAHSQVITATITFTNALNLTNAVAISNAVIKVNGDTRTFTNSIFDPTTQIRIATNIGTNIQQQANQFLVHVSTYPFAGVTVSSPNPTNVALRGTNTQAMEVLFGPTTYARVTYLTQTVSSAIGVRVPLTVESETTRTNVASGLGNWISSTTYNTNGIGHSLFTKFGLNGITISTNYTLSLSDLYVGVHSTTGAVALTLPTAASASNQVFFIKDQGSNAATTNITIQLAAATERIDTSTNKVINTSAGGMILISRGYTNWFSISTPGGGNPSAISSVNASNALFVSTSGSDATGTRGDISKPFATLLQAKTNALAGDTIFVWPGVYTNNQSLLKSNVNWHFYAGTYVTNIAAASALFGDLQIANIPSVITGDGEFFDTNYLPVELLSNSVVSISFRKISGADNSSAVSVSGSSQLYLNGQNEGIIENSTTTPTTTIDVNNVQTLLSLNRVKVINRSSSAAARTLIFFDANTNTFIRDSSMMVLHNNATNTIGHFGSIYPEIRVYGSLMVSTNVGPRINFLTGTNRVEVDGDVR